VAVQQLKVKSYESLRRYIQTETVCLCAIRQTVDSLLSAYYDHLEV
jgi:hypothetical protein